MIILREAATGKADLLTAANHIWETENDFPMEFAEIESALTSFGIDMNDFKGLEDIIYKSINGSDALGIQFLDNINNRGSSFNDQSSKNIEYVLSQIEINKINLKNKDLSTILYNANLYNRSQQDFKYTLYIANVLSDKGEAKKYFTDITDINVNLIIDSNGDILPAQEIEKIIDKLEQDDSSSDTDENNKCSVQEFLEYNKIKGNRSTQVSGLFNLFKKYEQRLNFSATLFEKNKILIRDLLIKLSAPRQSISQNMHKLSMNFFNNSFISDPAEVLNSLQEIINYLHVQLTQLPKLVAELENSNKKR